MPNSICFKKGKIFEFLNILFFEARKQICFLASKRPNLATLGLFPALASGGEGGGGGWEQSSPEAGS